MEIHLDDLHKPGSHTVFTTESGSPYSEKFAQQRFCNHVEILVKSMLDAFKKREAYIIEQNEEGIPIPCVRLDLAFKDVTELKMAMSIVQNLLLSQSPALAKHNTVTDKLPPPKGRVLTQGKASITIPLPLLCMPDKAYDIFSDSSLSAPLPSIQQKVRSFVFGDTGRTVN